jgi:flagellar biosynthesis protein FlhF
MNLRTYRARSMAEALAEVKKDLGKDAVILHTRSYRVGGVMGVGGTQEFEITASDQAGASGPRIRETLTQHTQTQQASGMPGQTTQSTRGGSSATLDQPPFRPAKPSSDPRRSGVENFVASSFTALGTGSTVVEVAGRESPSQSQPSSTMVEAKPSPLAAPQDSVAKRHALSTRVEVAPVDAASLAALKDEMGSIRGLVGQLLSETRRAVAMDPLRSDAGLIATTGLPETLTQAYVRLQEAGVRADLIERIVGGVRDELGPSELRDGSITQACVLKHVAAMFPTMAGITKAGRRSVGTTNRPLVLSFIGSTGVGKTTTVAKLAAVYRLRYKAKVGLITADTYRIAAVEQLKTYATIMGLPLKVALTPEEVTNACTELEECDVILCDTAGRSQHDHQRLEELGAFVEAAQPHETHMVLSAGASEDVSLAAWRRFGVLGPTHVLLTKLDEAVRFGTMLNLSAEIAASGSGAGISDRPVRLSFVATGQEVPDHVELAHPERLARTVLEGSMVRTGKLGA